MTVSRLASLELGISLGEAARDDGAHVNRPGAIGEFSLARGVETIAAID
jgi:hypothetical protein